MRKYWFTYILANKKYWTLYVGVTSDIKKRIFQHKNWVKANFTSRYGVNKLMYYEVYDYIRDAIDREKQLKAGSRRKKIELIEKENPQREDLYERIKYSLLQK